MLQNNYSYSSQVGVPGGLYDSSPHSVISRANGETDSGAIKFGYGVVAGSTAGVNVKLPVAESKAENFEGVVMTSIAEHDLDGGIRVDPTKTLGVLSWGKVWVRVADSLTIKYGEKAYLITSGKDAGKFTNSESSSIDIGAKFISAVDSGDVAAIELFNAPRVTAASEAV